MESEYRAQYFASCLRGPFHYGLAVPDVDAVNRDMTIADARNRSSLIPKPAVQLPTRTNPNTVDVWIQRSVFGIILMAIPAIGGPMLLRSFDETPQQVSDFWPLTSWDEDDSTQTSAHAARLVVESRKGFSNEPLPLGVSLEGASGSETVTVTGLANGFASATPDSIESVGLPELSEYMRKAIPVGAEETPASVTVIPLFLNEKTADTAGVRLSLEVSWTEPT